MAGRLTFAIFSAMAAASSFSLRTVDFANFRYPWSESRSWPDRLEWQSKAEPNHIHLAKGRWAEPGGDASLTLEEVVYGGLTGKGSEEAVVVLRFDTGWTQYRHWVYIFGKAANAPVLLAYFRAGDRAAQGLSGVFVIERKLVVELYDPARKLGDCCSQGIIRQRYQWDGVGFTRYGKAERSPTQQTVRRRGPA